MAKIFGIGLAVLMFASLLVVLAVFCHGLYARRQMNRYKQLAEKAPVAARRAGPKSAGSQGSATD